MAKQKQRLSKILFLILTAIIVFSTMPFGVAAAKNQTPDPNAQKVYEIVVVYDNSGSMYWDEDDVPIAAWCRAKYATEIFASMLDYGNGDKLKVIPMWGVTTDGTTTGAGASYAPIEINSKEDIDKISNMYTPSASGTPFLPVEEGHECLKNSTADEKWLVVLTDGTFNCEDRTAMYAEIDVQTSLEAMATDGIKVQYLGFNNADALTPNESMGFYAKSSTDTGLKDDLVQICNTIFQRHELPASYKDGQKVKLDLSMKKLIIFAQGANAKVNGIKDPSGKAVSITMDSGQRKYSRISCGGGENLPVDETLSGQVVTFGVCPKGEYTLDTTDAEQVQVFYEPDVSMSVKMVDSNGNEEENGKVKAGKYKIEGRVIDNVTGEDVTNHELLGGVDIVIKVKTNGDKDFKEYQNGTEVEFKPDSTAEIEVEGTYLEKYKISSKDNKDLDWLSKIKIGGSELEVKAKVEQPSSWYQIGKEDSWKPIRVDLSIEGQPLTEEQIKKVTLKIDVKDGLKYYYEPIAGESAFYIYIGKDESKKYVEPKLGRYKMEITATLDNGGTAMTGEDKAGFDVQNYPKAYRWLFALAIILGILSILIIITSILHKIKVLPKKIDTDNSVYKKDGKPAGAAAAGITPGSNGWFKKTATISVRATRGNFGISLGIESIHPLFRWLFRFQKSSRRNYRIVSIQANNMDYVKINGTKYTAATYAEVNEICNSQTTVEFEKNSGGKKHIKCDLVNV